VCDEGLEVDLAPLQSELARFDLRDEEEIADEPA
jgi:hypothetical protein